MHDREDTNAIEVGSRVIIKEDRQSLKTYTEFVFTVFASQIPVVVEQLKSKGGDPSWVSFLFDTQIPSTKTDDMSVHLQFSKTGGVLGIDWVLLDERNIVDKQLVIDFIESYGYSITARELNDVPFLRIEDGDLSALGILIAMELYQLKRDYVIELLVGRFTYKPLPVAAEIH